MNYWGWLERISSSSLSLYALVYIATSLWAPDWFLEKMAVFRLTGRSKWWWWPKIAVTAIGLGILIYSAAYGLIAAVPHSWGSYDEDDSWRSDRDYLRFLAGFIGALLLGERLEKNASVLVWGPIEKQSRVAVQSALRACTRLRADDIKVAKERIEQSLGAKDWEYKTIATEVRDELRAEILRSL